jgi:hypothetical protein
MFYENNLRSVAHAGVDVVMRSFFSQHGNATAAVPVLAEPGAGQSQAPVAISAEEALQQAFCEEELLEAFAK